MLQSRNCPIHGKLHILRKGRRHSTNIHFIRMESFRLNKYLMSFLICKLNHFIFNGRTISRSRAFNNSGINRRTIQISTYNFMGFFICISKEAGNLINLYILRIRGKRKRNNSFITELLIHLTEIQRTLIHSRRSSCFETTHLNTHFF